MDFGCWSLVAAKWAKYWSVVCGMEVVGANDLECGYDALL